MKIAVYGIALNEEAHVARYVASAADADLIQVADTGSADGTVAAFEALGAVVPRISIVPWRFDQARNAALARLPQDIDVCISLDLDQVLHPGWRPALEAAWTDGATRGLYVEIWGRHDNGQPRSLLNSRLHARHGYRWTAPCHEYLTPIGIAEREVRIEGLVIEQFQDTAKSRASYLPLLQLAAREDPDNPRHAFYLARELMYLERQGEAVAEFQRYLAFSPARFPSEHNGAWRLMAGCYEALGEREAAMAALRRAVEIGPQYRGAWIDLAWALYQREDWTGCYAACLRALALETSLGAPYGAESESGVLAEDMASLCAWRIGRQAEALTYGRAALALAPEVERIRANVARMEQALGKV